MDIPELSEEEYRYRLSFLSTVLRWSVGIMATLLAAGAVTFILRPSRTVIIANAEMLVAGLAIVWCYWRARRGELLWPTRVMLLTAMVTQGLFVLGMERELRTRMGLSFGLAVLLGTFLDRPHLAFRWAAIGAGIYATAILLPSIPGIPPPSALDSAASHLLIVMELGMAAALGRSMIRHLREALAKSESSRRDLSHLAASLERSNRELGRFAYVVSHDLRAPLRALTNYSTFIREEYVGKLDEACLGYVQGITESAMHMDTLVQGLLEYSRIGRTQEAQERVELHPLVERVAGRFRTVADVSLPAGAPIMRTSPKLLELVFTHLLDNAVKFQRPGVRPTIAVEWMDRGDAWEFAVRDNGIGIAPEHFEKIFGMFQRLHSREEYPGTGIGLAIVEKAVAVIGGRVWVESAPGQGTVFRFTVPKA